MNAEQLILKWFSIWNDGNVDALPISDDFIHESPYGVIKSRNTYLDIVRANKEKFMDHTFVIHRIIGEENIACVRYTAIRQDFRLEVTEWHYVSHNLINKVIAYYNIEAEISEERKIEGLN